MSDKKNEESQKALDEAKKVEQARKEARAKAKVEEEFKEEQTSIPVPEQKEQIITADYEALQKQLSELQSAFFSVLNQKTEGAQATSRGLVGTVEKYLLDPSNYPSPVERLSKEPKLQRFAFKENYELDFQVSSTQYQTIDGINMKEPKFTLSLHKIVFDEETGEPTDGRYVICNAILHEDPDAALVIARENNIEVDEENEKLFLNEMRYLRMRDWLLGVFYPPKMSSKSNKKEMVIGGRVVEYFEISSENSESIPFSQLRNKVK